MSFLKQIASIVNSNQTKSVVLTGNVYDLYFDDKNYVPLPKLLSSKLAMSPAKNIRGITPIVYEVNKPISFPQGKDGVIEAWHAKYKNGDDFEELCRKTTRQPALAFELLRKILVALRDKRKDYDAVVIIEAADMLLPESEISRMNLADRAGVSVIHDWLSDPEFNNGNDSVILISESKSSIHSRVSKLPQVLSIKIPYPNFDERRKYLERNEISREISNEIIAKSTAGLSIYALRQLSLSRDLTSEKIVSKVEEFIVNQLGEGVVEFKRPTHKFDDVIGFSRIKKFMKSEMIPRILGDKETALSGAAVGGPIGGGKTFLCEAFASEIDCPVLVLKNLRSQFFGQTDVIFERLQRALTALDKVVIFVDEADTQFGGIGEGTHATERRLTGKIQAMMSDPQLKGKIIWLLMTARINLLSPDIRRPGRVGDLIIPILDPEKEDREKFIKWVLKGIEFTSIDYSKVDLATEGYSAASFASLRSQIKAKNCKTIESVLQILFDLIPPDIGDAREYQTLQAKINCTRASLLFDDILSREEIQKKRNDWKENIKELEKKGIC